MDIDLEIHECFEDDYAPRGKVAPLTLEHAGVDRILGRKILKWAPKGSYGNGGTGFFAIHLERKDRYPREWLVLAYWGSHGWLLLNGNRLDVIERERRFPGEWLLAPIATLLGPLNFLLLPIVLIFKVSANVSRPLWDKEWRNIVGSEISEANITEAKSEIKISKGATTAILKIPLPGPELPRGDRWILKGSHLEAWKISPSGRLFC
jgi:hypothetical protein